MGSEEDTVASPRSSMSASTPKGFALVGGDMAKYDREYTVVVEPDVRFRFAYGDEGRVDAVRATLEYRRDGEWEGAAADAEPDAERGIELRGRTVDVIRDGESLLGGGVTAGLASVAGEEALDAAADVTARARETVDRRGGHGRDTESVTVTQSDGERLDVPLADAKARFEVFRDGAGEWRWRLVHDNGNIIADSGEGYASKANARKGLRSVKRNAAAASVREE